MKGEKNWPYTELSLNRLVQRVFVKVTMKKKQQNRAESELVPLLGEPNADKPIQIWDISSKPIKSSFIVRLSRQTQRPRVGANPRSKWKVTFENVIEFNSQCNRCLSKGK